tara:strand:- start:33368 stop:34267 length:900 start_codon:yes stop_codon:yes gene_type:complete
MKNLIFFIVLYITSCQLIDQPEPAPSFIKVNRFDFNISTSNQGSASEKITDVWVYLDNNLEGVYELPESDTGTTTIPLHYQGVHELKLYPGIKRNGISADRKKYPFYTPYTIVTELFPDSIIEISPETFYEENLFFKVENFEDPNHFFNSTSTSQVDLTIIDQQENETFEGSSGAVNMNSSHYFFETRTNELDFNSFPKNLNIPAYIEMDYANNHPFEIGILHKDASIPTYQKQALITLVPTFENGENFKWNKTYLYISDATNFYTSATEFDLYISVLNNNQLDDIKIRLDNFKVIYRP